MPSSVPAALAGRVVLITGASRGIGRALALAAAAGGAQVIAAARDVRALEALADASAAAGYPAPVLLPINLEAAAIDDYADVAAHVHARFGRLDGLVLGAAALGDLTPLALYDPLTWARVFQVNVHSALLLSQACWPLLRASGRGSLVVTLAEEAFTAKANWGAYAASKWALRGMFETWAREASNDPTVRVNAVVPGPTRTRLRMNAYPAADAAALPPPESAVPLYLELLDGRDGERNGVVLRPG